MKDTFVENHSYENLDFTQEPLNTGTYEECNFISCNFTGLSLTDFRFIDCEFINCNLSLVKPGNTVLRETGFRNCKMTGIRFDYCHATNLSIRFESCLLQLASFYGMKIPGTLFADCNLKEADFTGTDLSRAVFRRTDLYRAVFENTLLEQADLRTAENYSIDPESNYLSGARVSSEGLVGLLTKYNLDIE